MKRKIVIVISIFLIILSILLLKHCYTLYRIENVVKKCISNAEDYKELGLSTKINDSYSIETFGYKNNIQCDTMNLDDWEQFYLYDFIKEKSYYVDKDNKKVVVNNYSGKPFQIEMLKAIVNNNSFTFFNYIEIKENNEIYTIKYYLKDISCYIVYKIAKDSGLLVEKTIIGDNIIEKESYSYKYTDINVSEFSIDKYKDYEIVFLDDKDK